MAMSAPLFHLPTILCWNIFLDGLTVVTFTYPFVGSEAKSL